MLYCSCEAHPVSCLADPKTWQPAVGASEASALVARLVGFLASKCSLFPRLAQLLLAACPPASHKQHQSQQQQPQQQQQQSVMSITETLASNLAVRFLSLKRFPEVAAAQASMAKLLCVPLLWLRCPHVLFSVSITSKQTLILHTHTHTALLPGRFSFVCQLLTFNGSCVLHGQSTWTCTAVLRVTRLGRLLPVSLPSPDLSTVPFVAGSVLLRVSYSTHFIF